MSPWWQIDDIMGELSRLWSQAIVLPWRRHREQGAAPPAKGAQPTLPPWKGEGKRSEAARGTLILIGGSRIGDEIILEMIHAAGGRNARIAVLPTASLDFSRGGQRYARSLRRFGATRVETVEIVTRERAQDPAWAARLAENDLIFLGGGDEALLLSIMAGTPAQEALAGAYRRGAVVAGIGAGATVMGRWVAAGEPGDIVPGLGLLPGVLVDQRGNQGGRPGKLFHAVARHPGPDPLVGLGIDEDTALAVGPDLAARVVGQGMVLVVNRPSDAASQADQTPSPAIRVLVHVLPAGAGYDFALHRPIPTRATAGVPGSEPRPADLIDGIIG